MMIDDFHFVNSESGTEYSSPFRLTSTYNRPSE
jgi:hypothetical protein